MKKIKLNVVNENLYYEKIENGLEIYLIKKENFNTSYACFCTNFGGIDVEFIPINEKEYVKMPSGIAHFLEHKLFEQKNGESVHDFYKKSGTYVNAFTNYKYTKYIFNGANNFINNLDYLLDYVQDPYFTDENVLKEKGIILEEAYMVMDNPDRLFNSTIMKNIYNEIPYYNTVIGSIEDIKSITKEDLYRCYYSFYHPSNMALLIVTNEDEKEVINRIKENQSKKEFKKDFIINKKEYIEKENVKKEKEIIKGNALENRLCYSIKMPLSKLNCSLIEAYDYFSILFGILIGNLSKYNLDLKEKNIIKDNIFYSISSDKAKNETYVIFKIFALTEKYDYFINSLEKILSSKDYNEELFNLYKKTFISDLNYMFNTVNGTMNFMMMEYDFYKKISNDIIDFETNLNYERFIEVTNNLSLKNKSIVIMEKK